MGGNVHNCFASGNLLCLGIKKSKLIFATRLIKNVSVKLFPKKMLTLLVSGLKEKAVVSGGLILFDPRCFGT